MLKRFLIVFSVLIFAFGILFTSVLRTASVKYSFSGVASLPSEKGQVLGESQEKVIDYYLPYEGKVLPDHPLWQVKAFRDRLWLLLTTNSGKKADLKLLFADKRLSSAKVLFERNKAEVAFSTLSKAEKYLEEAYFQEEESRMKGDDTAEFLQRLTKASLKHREVINEILEIAPHSARPEIVKIEDYSKNVFEKCMQALQEKGLEVPENPFDSQ